MGIGIDGGAPKLPTSIKSEAELTKPASVPQPAPGSAETAGAAVPKWAPPTADGAGTPGAVAGQPGFEARLLQAGFERPPARDQGLPGGPARPPVALTPGNRPAGRPATNMIGRPPAAQPSSGAAHNLGEKKLTQSITDAVRATPAQLKAPNGARGGYDLRLEGPNNEILKVNPGREQLRPTTRSARSMSDPSGAEVAVNAEGGFDVKLESGPFKNAEWTKGSFREALKDHPNKQELYDELEKQGYGLDKERDLMLVASDADRQPTVFAFSEKAPRGLVTMCTEVQSFDMPADTGGGSQRPMATVRKPVVYLYPEKPTDVTVRVQLEGKFTVQYPKADGDTWRLFAQPDGMLFDRKTEKKYSYIFWEGHNPNSWTLDAAKSFCVASADAEKFLDNASGRFGLNDRERTDFISYWLPALEKNAYTQVQFLDDDTYERYAKMDVSPTPTSVIRLFMIFKGLDAPIATGNPNLSLKLRKGFCVVEWGGANLDENTEG